MQETCGYVSRSRGPRCLTKPAGGTVQVVVRTVSTIQEGDAKGPGTRCSPWMSAPLTSRRVRYDVYLSSAPRVVYRHHGGCLPVRNRSVRTSAVACPEAFRPASFQVRFGYRRRCITRDPRQPIGGGVVPSHKVLVRVERYRTGVEVRRRIPIESSLGHPGAPVGEHVLDASLGLCVSRDDLPRGFGDAIIDDVVAQ